MRNKIIDIYQSGEGYRPGTPVNHDVSHYLQKEKIWNNGEPARSVQLTKMTPKMASMGEFKEENQDLKGPRA